MDMSCVLNIVHVTYLANAAARHSTEIALGCFADFLCRFCALVDRRVPCSSEVLLRYYHSLAVVVLWQMVYTLAD
jgi:hypothetical protein